MNNKGFATSTVLYGLLVVFVLSIMLIFQIMKSNSSNSKDLSGQIRKEYSACGEKKIDYDYDYDDTKQGAYTECLNTQR